tara:strand:- start:437 stop:772 length:336 start_codon:yes stop_codon:yes gene_type:complete
MGKELGKDELYTIDLRLTDPDWLRKATPRNMRKYATMQGFTEGQTVEIEGTPISNVYNYPGTDTQLIIPAKQGLGDYDKRVRDFIDIVKETAYEKKNLILSEIGILEELID